jgi:hypothetical protein
MAAPVKRPRRVVGSPGPWDLHVDYVGNGDTHYQFQAANGEVVLTINDAETDTPGIAAQNAATLHLLFAEHFGDIGASDGDHAARVTRILDDLDWTLPKKKPAKTARRA